MIRNNRLASLAVAICASLLVMACGGDKKPTLGEDWSARALSPVNDKAHGVAFTISLPDKFKKRADNRGDISVEWHADKGDYFSEPSVSVSFAAIPPDSVDKAVRYAMVTKKHTISRKEAFADGSGFVVTHHSKDKGYVLTHVWKKAGDKVLSCRASQAKSGGVPSPDATIKWLESICMSLKAR